VQQQIDCLSKLSTKETEKNYSALQEITNNSRYYKIQDK